VKRRKEMSGWKEEDDADKWGPHVIERIAQMQ
jgi:hypothetical protein